MAHVACPKKTIPTDKVDSLIAEQGNKSTTVTFYKVDGTLSTGNGLPKVFVRRIDNEKGKIQAARMKTTGQRFFDFATPKTTESGRVIPGFSFFADRVVEIKAGGVVLASNDYDPADLARDLAAKEAANDAKRAAREAKQARA